MSSHCTASWGYEVFVSKVQVCYDLCPFLGVAEQDLCLPQSLPLVGKKRNEPDPYQLVGDDLTRSPGNKPSTEREGKAKPTRKECCL